jgi:hypothetical protein
MAFDRRNDSISWIESTARILARSNERSQAADVANGVTNLPFARHAAVWTSYAA